MGAPTLQFGFIKGIGSFEQCVNLDLLVGKYTLAKSGALYLCFTDLSSAFDLVDHDLLWQIMLTLGAPRAIINFLACMY